MMRRNSHSLALAFGKYTIPDPRPAGFEYSSSEKDAIIIGGGHNGLVAAAYLGKQGKDVLVLERRGAIGGCAITEEIFPGFKFSRASYLAGLLRPSVIKELELERFGLKYLPRDPSSFTPTTPTSPEKGKYLMFHQDAEKTYQSVAQFSKNDAEALPKYEAFLDEIREIVRPLLDMAPPQYDSNRKLRSLKDITEVLKVGLRHKQALIPALELLTGPAAQILDRWFESDILKTTLATDAIIGALISPRQAGSAYVLLHHVMGESAGRAGVWSYVEGGMGAISNAILRSAQRYKVQACTDAMVKRILVEGGRAAGVELMDGTKIRSKIVVSGANPHHTFAELCENQIMDRDFLRHIHNYDYSCGAMKINCAVDSLPNFLCIPNESATEPGPQHRGTVHFETRMEEIEAAYKEASNGFPATRPVIEMTIPTSADRTIAPAGKHIVQLFVQYIPYDLNPSAGSWEDGTLKEKVADRVFGIIEEHAPGFRKSVIARDILSPLDLERTFGLYRGNIFHGSLSLSQLAYNRPAPRYSSYETPVPGLYMCGSGAHPGGGVMGSAGRNCARVIMDTC